MTETKGIASDVMDVVLKAAANEGINIDLTVFDLQFVTAYVLALRPDLDTPQKIRFHTQELAKELADLIVSARKDQAAVGLADMVTVERRVVQ